MTSLVDRLWYGRRRPLWFLAPLAWLYRAISESRRRQAWAARNTSLPAPVVVVGNITAGGTGKSPLTAWLVQQLVSEGLKPVILSRGYGGKSKAYPLRVDANTDPAVAGDEPVMLARTTGRPVVVDPQRLRGGAYALAQNLGNVLICDDGLQHYQLPRDVELAVFDGTRGIGNGSGIPVGPLREQTSRLASVDFLVVNGGGYPEGERLESFDGIEHPQIHTMALAPASLVNLKTAETRPLSVLQDRTVRAVAGIGNPARFFDTLRALGAQVVEAPLPDHHAFKARDLSSEPGQWVVITAKDAVKCQDFASDNVWVLAVEARLSKAFAGAVMARIRENSELLTS